MVVHGARDRPRPSPWSGGPALGEVLREARSGGLPKRRPTIGFQGPPGGYPVDRGALAQERLRLGAARAPSGAPRLGAQFTDSASVRGCARVAAPAKFQAPPPRD